MPCNLCHEDGLRRRGFRAVAGVDEAGRGPLAGPVVAAAVVLPAGFSHPVLDDSKKLTHRRRESLYHEIAGDAEIVWASSSVGVEEIESLNILKATWAAMARALGALAVEEGVDVALVDGLEVRGLPVPHEALVGGDGISLSIAAASVVAKVERDRMMVEYASQFPEYGFEKHKGYATKQHLECLRRHGPCPIHRKTFQPVAQLAVEI